MYKYIVLVREIWVQPVEIESEFPLDEDELKQLVYEGEGTMDEDAFEFSHCMPEERWTVKEIEND